MMTIKQYPQGIIIKYVWYTIKTLLIFVLFSVLAYKFLGINLHLSMVVVLVAAFIYLCYFDINNVYLNLKDDSIAITRGKILNVIEINNIKSIKVHKSPLNLIPNVNVLKIKSFKSMNSGGFILTDEDTNILLNKYLP